MTARRQDRVGPDPRELLGLGEGSEWRRPHGSARLPAQRSGELGGIDPAEPLDHRVRGQCDVRRDVVRVAGVDPERQRPPERGPPRPELEHRLDEVMARVAVDADREVNRDASPAPPPSGCSRAAGRGRRPPRARRRRCGSSRPRLDDRLRRASRAGLGSGSGWTGSWITQRFEPAIWSTKTSWTS